MDYAPPGIGDSNQSQIPYMAYDSKVGQFLGGDITHTWHYTPTPISRSDQVLRSGGD